MPWTYRCHSCELDFEVWRRVDPACPGCGSDSDVGRVPDPVNFILKGSGWAVDGYSGSGEKEG